VNVGVFFINPKPLPAYECGFAASRSAHSPR
jgi:hypothetical protein